jgi:hypothetical protein
MFVILWGTNLKYNGKRLICLISSNLAKIGFPWKPRPSLNSQPITDLIAGNDGPRSQAIHHRYYLACADDGDRVINFTVSVSTPLNLT